MVKLFLNSTNVVETTTATQYEDLLKYVTEITNLPAQSFYLEQNGKRLEDGNVDESPLYVRLRLLGGKGGFGSMLRAIGAQIEKTTNREACRDLSGRRLRDINEEKRLKAWLDKQGEREREAEERKKRKIEKLLAVPKHEFKDKEYEEARSKLTEKVCDSVEEGLKKAQVVSNKLKRIHEPSTSRQAVAKTKKKKAALWIDDDLSDDSDDSDDSVDEDSVLDKKPNKVEKNDLKVDEEREAPVSATTSLVNQDTNSLDSKIASVSST